MNYGNCPRCSHGTLFKDSRTGDVECFACGYEMLPSVPVGMNPDYWKSKFADQGLAELARRVKVKQPV